MAKPNGAIIYRGPSEIDGKPIVVIATGLAKSSRNGKTGALVQTWILREDINPIAAANSGDDVSICGQCPHRGQVVNGKNVNRSCYVTLFQAPRNIWQSYHRGIYADHTKTARKLLAGKKVRLGAYGDPAAVPTSVWKNAMADTAGGTGYTHQWREMLELAAWCMASADSPQEAREAQANGFRTFRVATKYTSPEIGEILCPASEQAGRRTNCADCGLCSGKRAMAKNIVIPAHGSSAKIKAAHMNI